jgi:hypothetical protein
MVWILGRNLALSLAAAALLAGCGARSPAGSGPAKTPARTAKTALSPSDELSRSMVSAVPANKPSTVPLQVKFELRDRPDIGQPLELDLAIVPMSGAVDRVWGKVEGEDGLDLVDGAEIAPAEHPVEGAPIRHVVKVLPQREGIFTVRAVLTVDAGGSPSTESYLMPVIADSDGPAAPGKTAAGPAAAAVVAAAASARAGQPPQTAAPAAPAAAQ